MAYVYFIQSGESGPVKIGIADNPYKRLVELQVGSPERLTIRAMFMTETATDERRLHEEFEEEHISGEWFRSSPRLMALVGSYGPLPPQARIEGDVRDVERGAREAIWAASVAHDPRISQLYERAARIRDNGGPVFCATDIWYKELKPELQRLVSWNHRNPLFRTAKFFDMAYNRIYCAMPPCRGVRVRPWCDATTSRPRLLTTTKLEGTKGASSPICIFAPTRLARVFAVGVSALRTFLHLEQRQDLLSKTGAEDLARRITAHWNKRGYYTVEVWIDRLVLPEKGAGPKAYCVQSNLVNGFPPAL